MTLEQFQKEKMSKGWGTLYRDSQLWEFQGLVMAHYTNDGGNGDRYIVFIQCVDLPLRVMNKFNNFETVNELVFQVNGKIELLQLINMFKKIYPEKKTTFIEKLKALFN